LPLTFLCKDECRGLCPRCGRSQNEAACVCMPSVLE
jgi:uncharacterized protein